MKTKITLSIALIALVLNFNAQENQKEILIVGTMHTVPKIVKHSYKPMLKRALKYNPTSVFVESPIANDNASWEYLKDGWSENYKSFYYLSDSIKNIFKPNTTKYHSILDKNFKDMTPIDIDLLIETFAYNRDHANYQFYKYIKKHGINGSKKPTRHEDGDLTFKVALSLNIKLLKSMDDQHANGKYHKAWSKCVKEGAGNGNNLIGSKISKKTYSSAKLPAIFRGLGKHTNKQKALKRLHDMSSFSYAKVKTQGCIDGKRFWDIRNAGMAKNIATNVMNSNSKRNIVFVGASHVIGLKEEFKAKYPNLKVILTNE